MEGSLAGGYRPESNGLPVPAGAPTPRETPSTLPAQQLSVARGSAPLAATSERRLSTMRTPGEAAVRGSASTGSGGEREPTETRATPAEADAPIASGGGGGRDGGQKPPAVRGGGGAESAGDQPQGRGIGEKVLSFLAGASRGPGVGQEAGALAGAPLERTHHEIEMETPRPDWSEAPARSIKGAIEQVPGSPKTALVERLDVESVLPEAPTPANEYFAREYAMDEAGGLLRDFSAAAARAGAGTIQMGMTDLRHLEVWRETFGEANLSLKDTDTKQPTEIAEAAAKLAGNSGMDEPFHHIAARSRLDTPDAQARLGLLRREQ